MPRGAADSDVRLETPRLLLRPWRVEEAAVQREMWLERDPRVPPHRRIDADGNPSLAAHEPELAFELLRRCWGLGYATEAGWAVLDQARASGHERLWASVWEWNTASLRVLAKLGFTESDREETPYGTNVMTTRAL